MVLETIQETSANDEFVNEICTYPGGESVKLCIQCGTCVGACPNASKMDHPVRQLIAMARAGLREEVLSSNSSWFCLSCYLCTVRCPRGIKPTEFMHALDAMAFRDGKVSKRTRIPVLYRSFINLVIHQGTVSELQLMSSFFLHSNPFRAITMIPIAINLIRHKRLSLRPHKIKPDASAQLKIILAKARILGGT